jgi:hypothetical protein
MTGGFEIRDVGTADETKVKLVRIGRSWAKK